MKDNVESPGRLRVKGFAVIAVAMLVGGILGITVERTRVRLTEPERPPWDQRGEGRRGFRGPDGFNRPGGFPPAFEQLNLSETQRERMQEVFESRRPLTDSVMEEAMRQLDAARESVQAEIDSILTPEQRETFRELFDDRMRFRDGFRGDRPRRGRGFSRDSN